MANGSSVIYTVTNASARRLVVSPAIASIAAEIAASAAALTPIGPPIKGHSPGQLAGSYSTKRGRDAGTSLAVAAPVGHGKYIEYGSRRIRAIAPMGRAFAAAKGKYG